LRTQAFRPKLKKETNDAPSKHCSHRWTHRAPRGGERNTHTQQRTREREMTLRRGKSAATTLLVLCCLAAIAVAGVAAQFEDAPAANATTADANATAAPAPESDDTAPDTIDSAPAPEASKDSSGGGTRKVVTGAKTTAQVATSTAANTANAVATGGNAPTTNTTAPGPGFEGLTEPLPEGYGCYNMTNLLCNCTSGITQEFCAGLGGDFIWTDQCACASGPGAPKFREIYTNFLPSNVPGGLPNQGGSGAGDQVPDSVQAYRAEGRRKLSSS